MWGSCSCLWLCLSGRDVQLFFKFFLFSPLYPSCSFIYEFGDLLLWSEAWRRSGKGGKWGQNAAYRSVRAYYNPLWDYYHNNNNLNARRKYVLGLLSLSIKYILLSYLLRLCRVDVFWSFFVTQLQQCDQCVSKNLILPWKASRATSGSSHVCSWSHSLQ